MDIFSNGVSHLPQGQRIHLPMQGFRICSSIPGLGRSPGGETGNPLQYSCLGNPMDRGTLQATIHGGTELDMTEQLTHTIFCGFFLM